MTVQLDALATRLAGRVPDEILSEFVDYIRAGEPKLGVEALCDALYDSMVPLRLADVEDINAAGRELGVTRRSFQLISELVQE
jgi:hypothetical protein